MEWARGWPLSEAGALTQPGLDRKLTADNLIRAFLAQALDHGVVSRRPARGETCSWPPPAT
jgi:ubiquinone biosynthesis protein